MKKTTKLKALALSLMMTILMLPSVQAQQIDDYFKTDGYDLRGDAVTIWTVNNGIQNDDFGAPLGSGLLVLTAVGAGYAVAKRKRNFKKGTTLLLAAMMLLGMTACRKNIAEPVATSGNKVAITLNVGGGAKAEVDPPHVNFETGDQILVASNGHYVGTLTATKTGTDVTFSGDITDPVVGEPLYFYFLGNKATGTLTPGASGSTSCTVDISDQTSELPVISMGVSIDRSNGNAVVNYSSGVTDYEAQLHNKASLIKFNVTTPSTSPIYLTGMYNTVTVNFADLTTNDGFSYSNAGYIRMKGKDAENVTWAIVLPQADLTGAGEAYTKGYSGTWNTAAVDLAAANQYIIGDGDGIALTVNTPDNSRILDLATVTSNQTVEDGWIVTGTLGTKSKISIAAGATVILDDATITYASNGADYAGLTCLGDATIVLADGTTNTIVGGLDGDGYSNWPGIFVPAGSTLTINGNTGELNARRGGNDTNNGSPAGIGASWKNPCGNIVINGGVINAVGGAKSAGIGGTFIRACGDITINGGTITATGHKWGVGIGLGGTENASATSLSGGNITITGGTVIATGGDRGAGIGTGSAEHKSEATMTITLGNILISGGTVTAIGGQYGAGIGIGNSEVDNINKCGTITIEGGTVTATGGEKAAGIGCGRKNQGNNNSECGAITISGGTVSATGGAQAAGIGCGYHDVDGNTGDLKCGDITITSGVISVTATKGSDAHNCIGVNKTTNRTTCTSVTIGGTLYWGPAGATYYYANGGDTYLTESPCVYPKP